MDLVIRCSKNEDGDIKIERNLGELIYCEKCKYFSPDLNFKINDVPLGICHNRTWMYFVRSKDFCSKAKPIEEAE